MSDWDQFQAVPATPAPAPASGNDWGQFQPVISKDPNPGPADKLVASSPTMKDATNPYEGFMAGLHMSASVIPFSRPSMDIPANASFFTKLSGSIGQGLGDLPVNIAGALGGAVAGAAVPVAGETGISEVAGGGAGAMAVPQAVRETMMDYYADKDSGVMTAGDFLHQVANSSWNITKAAAMGAVGGVVAGKFAGPVAEGLGGSAFAHTAANVTAFSVGATGAQAALDGKLPDAQDLAIGAITAVGLGVAGHIAPTGRFVPTQTGEAVMDNMQKIYRQTGIPPWEQASMAKDNPALHDELLGRDVNGDPVIPTFNSQRPPEPEQDFKTNPAKIANEHEAEVSSIAADAHIRQHVEELLPQVKTLETGGLKDPDAAISHTGAVGRYQIQPGTARQYGFDPSKLHDPQYNEMVARHVLSDLSRRFHGDTEAVLVAYNAGPGRAMQFVMDGRDTSKLPYETQGYLTKAGFGGKGGEPPTPPVPPEEPPAPEGEDPHEVPSAREQDFSKLTDEMMVSRFQDSIGEEPSRPSTGSNIMRQWVSELESARNIDQQMQRAGLIDPNKDITFEDMQRQTYASDDRTNYMMVKGNIDPVTLDAKAGPSMLDVLGMVKEAGGNMDEFDAFRVAQRTVDLDARGVDTGVFKGGVVEAGNILQRPAFQKYRAINEAMQTWKRGGLEYGRDSGLFHQGNIDAMEAASSHVSLRRIRGDNAAFSAGGKGSLKVANPLKAMEGSNRQIVKPLLADIDNMRQIIRMSDRNRAIGHLLGGQEAMTDAARIQAEQLGLRQLPAPEVKAMLAEPGSSVFKPYNMTPEQEAAVRPFAIESNKSANSGNRFTYYRNGVPEVWEANDPDLANLMRGADNQGDPTTIKLFGKIINLDKVLQGPAALERAGIMGNLDTALTVPGKHQLTAWTLDPLHPPPYITMVKGLHDALTKGDAYWDLMRRGGLSGAMTDMDMAGAVDKTLQEQHILQETGAISKAWNVAATPLHFAQQITETLTHAERIGYYKRATEDLGIDPNKAAMMGRRAYIDFSEKATGVVANKLAKMIPFFRASLLGVKYVRDGVVADPKGAILRTTLGLVGTQMALYALNRGQDKFLPENERYSSLPQWERDQYFVTPQINGTRFKLGRPYVIGPMVGVPVERMMEAALEKNPHAYDNFLSSWLGDMVPNIIPATLRPVVEQISNHNFFAGKPLVSDSLREATPDMQYSQNTSEVAKKVSSLLGDHTGLGLANVSPIVLDNYAQAWSGTVGMSVLHALDVPLGKDTSLNEFKDNIFVRGFVIQNPRMATQQIDDFYKDANQFSQLHRDITLEVKAGNEDQAIADNATVGRKAALAVRIEHALTVQRTALAALGKNQKMNIDEKRQLSERIYNDAWRLAEFGSRALRGGNVTDEEAQDIGDQATKDVGQASGE